MTKELLADRRGDLTPLVTFATYRKLALLIQRSDRERGQHANGHEERDEEEGEVAARKRQAATRVHRIHWARFYKRADSSCHETVMKDFGPTKSGHQP